MTRVPYQPPRKTPCKIAFLGEAPGQDEIDQTGLYTQLAKQMWPGAGWTGVASLDRIIADSLPPLPLVGPSGNLFNAILRAAGIDRLDVWVGNVFEEKAEGNDVTAWIRDPVLSAAALARLSDDLAAAQPTVVVPMGATALWAMTEMTNITKMRGAPCLATRVLPGVKLIPTFHPAYVVRQWKTLPLVIQDVIRAKSEAAKGPGLEFPKITLLIEPTKQDLRVWAPILDGSDLLAVDIETGWGQITCVGFAPDPDRAICVPFFDSRQVHRCFWHTLEEEVYAWEWVKERCESPTPKVLQNGVYDAYWLLTAKGIRIINYLHDTRLQHHALYPVLPKDLAFLAAGYAELPAWKHWADRKGEKRDD